MTVGPAPEGWRRFATTFKAQEDEKELELRVNTDSPTPGLWLDDLKLEEGEAATYCEPAEPATKPWLTLDTPAGPIYAEGGWQVAATAFAPAGATQTPLEVTLAPFSGTPSRLTRTLPSGRWAITAWDDRGSLQPDARLSFRLGEGAAPAQTSFALQVRSAEAAREGLASLRAVLPTLHKAADDLRARSADLSYPDVSLAVLDNFVGYVADDLRHGEYRRAWEQLEDLRRMAAGLRASLRRSPEAFPRVPRWVPSPLRIEGPAFLGETTGGAPGPSRTRPVIFTGYGHFRQVIDDLEKWKGYGSNIVQIEMGPSSVFPREGVTDLGPVDALAAVYDRAAASGVAVCQLISPHYMPDWALTAHPELKVKREGFIQYCIHAPEGRLILRQFIEILMRRIGNHPALHSICLSNEPVNVEDPGCPFAQAAWKAWLRKRYGTVERLNKLWKSEYASLDAVPLPEAAVRPDPLHYEFVLFNQDVFAGWHRFLADCVHRVAPKVPVHAKAMAWTLLGDQEQRFGVDAELFGSFSQINGNDSVNNYGHGQDEWAQGWQLNAMAFDLQRSVLDAPVMNTENHVIPDRDTRPVPPEHLRTALWQAAIHGQSATTLWVWERAFDPKSDFAGSIMHRPACVRGVGETGLDLMRLSREVTAFQSARPQVAMLYSTSSMVFDDGDYTDCAAKTYAALSFTGLKVGFVTERQLAAGKRMPASVLIVPNARHLTQEAWEGLRRFKGTVLLLGADSLRWDPYGRERELPAGWLRAEYTRGRTSAQSLSPAIGKALESAGVKPAVQVSLSDGAPAWGVEWRCVHVKDRLLVNLVNYNRKPVRLSVKARVDSPARDLLTETLVGGRLTLDPLQPMLLEY
jgi:hypothetical protein